MKRNAFTLVEIDLVCICIIAIIVSIGGAFIGGCNSATSGKVFSSGERVGTVAKVGYKGNVTKSWSAEVALQGSGQMWETDVKDQNPAVVAKLKKASYIGKTVVVAYDQPSEENVDYHYSTPYRAIDVSLLDDKGNKVDIEVSPKDIDAIKAETK